MMNLKQLSRQEKIELLELMEEKARRRRQDPLKYLEQHNKQKEASASEKAIRVLFWGNRVGKTEWGGQEASMYAAVQHPFKALKPPYEIWSACPSYDVQEHTTQQKLLRYIPPKSIEKIVYLRDKIIKKIELKHGITILFKSYEQGREKFQGAGVRLIWFDEEPPKDIWDESFVRIEAGQQLDVIMTMTPIKGMTWVYDRIYKDTSNPDLFVSTAGWKDNPWLLPEQLAQLSRGLSQESLAVRRDGKFVKRVGLVCNWWDRSKHMRHYDNLPRSWTWFEVLDGGWSDPACWLLVGIDHDDNIHVVDGYRRKYQSKARLRELRDTKVSGLTITQGWVDNDDPRLKDELYNEGWSLTAVSKKPNETKSWDETLAEKLSEYGMIQKGTGEPRLFISDTLMEVNEETGDEENFLMQEIENLVWQESKTKDGEEIKPKWDDHRRFGHHFDGIRALSYLMISYKKPEEEDEDDHYTSGNVSDFINQ
ncbi:hypothetical protein I8H89_00370 [Candidatus Saccharibacteria bacterium]|nr:hypothetical protein [Candidatus Saccharibacteria bacterium]